MESDKRMKICFAASSGGHYEQLMMLKPLMEEYDSFVVTEQTDYSAKAKGEKTYYMSQVCCYLYWRISNDSNVHDCENGGEKTDLY